MYYKYLLLALTVTQCSFAATHTKPNLCFPILIHDNHTSHFRFLPYPKNTPIHNKTFEEMLEAVKFFGNGVDAVYYFELGYSFTLPFINITDSCESAWHKTNHNGSLVANTAPFYETIKCFEKHFADDQNPTYNDIPLSLRRHISDANMPFFQSMYQRLVDLNLPGIKSEVQAYNMMHKAFLNFKEELVNESKNLPLENEHNSNAHQDEPQNSKQQNLIDDQDALEPQTLLQETNKEGLHSKQNMSKKSVKQYVIYIFTSLAIAAFIAFLCKYYTSKNKLPKKHAKKSTKK